MNPRLTFVGPVNSYTGYGLHSLQIIRDLARLTGAFISVRATTISESFGTRIPSDVRERLVHCIQPEPWELLLHPPNFLPTPGKRTVFFSMWESTRLPAIGPRVLNLAEQVVVPSVFCRDVFQESGVKRPIAVVPLGIKEDVFQYRHLHQADICVFGAGGRMAHGATRKGINDVIEAFRIAFPREKDVRLRVKGFADCPMAEGRDWRIEQTKAYMTEPELAAWYAGLTCFVSACRGEGWGLMQHQAMATGRPVISINWGGVREFFDPECGYALDYRVEPATGIYAHCGEMATPNRESLVERMREVYRDREAAIQKGQRAAFKVRNLTWNNANQKLAGVLQLVGAL